MTTKEKEVLLTKMFSIIRKNPGIRPSQINKLLGVPHTWSLRSTLVKRGLVKKEKNGSAVYYYSK